MAVLYDIGGRSAGAAAELYGNCPVGAEYREEQERYIAAESEEDAHVGGGIGFVEALLAE